MFRKIWGGLNDASSQRSFFFFYKEAIGPFMFKKLGSQVAGMEGTGVQGGGYPGPARH